MTTTITVDYGHRSFDVNVILSERKTLSLTVYPDQRVTARAPIDHNMDWIRKRLNKRAKWIARNVDYFSQFHPQPTPRRYVSGETHYYLGRQYRLRIREGSKAQVRLIGAFFEMTQPDPSDTLRAKKTMQAWHRDHAQQLLLRRIEKHWPVFERMGIERPIVRFRKMKRRWGSCSQKGGIMLNTELVKAPSHCIDYVVVHELCHLVHPNHNRAFFRLLSRVMPDWEDRKERLDQSSMNWVDGR